MKFSMILTSVSSFLSRNKIFFLLGILYFAFTTYFFRGVSTLDPDFGWRYRVGEIIYHMGIPKTDPFSYTMPTFPFVDHAWVFSLLVFLSYSIFKNNLLSLLLAFLVFLSVFITNSRPDDEDFLHTDQDLRFAKWIHPMSIAVLCFLLLYFSVRAQILSWFMFSLFNYLLFKKDNFSRYKYFFPLIFFIWANLHGGYFLGLMVFLYFIVYRFIFQKKRSPIDAVVIFLSALATLVTPYGLNGWREVTSSVFDSRLRWTIAEWLPSVTYFDISMVFYISVSVFMVFLKRKGLPRIQYFLYWGLLLFGITSIRNMPFFMLYSLPLTIISINKFYLEVHSEKGSKERFRLAFNALLVFSVIVLVLQAYFTYWRVYVLRNSKGSGSYFYPVKSVLYLKEKEVKRQIFSNYGWGGYLIWNLPEKKVFIDGRMPSWKFKPVDPKIESASAYDDYLKIEHGELDFNTVADKYGIEYVLWPKEKEGFYKNIEKKIMSLGIFNKKRNDFSFTKYLDEHGWKLIYSDENSEVFRRFNEQRI